MLRTFLVEDEVIIRENIKRMVPWEKYGFELVGEAADGEMALPLIRKSRPDILITDIKMPFMDGLTLSKLVKKEIPNIKIVILSGYDDFNYAKQAINIGVEDYLLKPITKKALLERLEEIRNHCEDEKTQQEYYEKFRMEMQEYEQYASRDFFENLVRGNMNAEEIYRRADKLNIDIVSEAYNILIFTPDINDNTYDSAEYSDREAEVHKEIGNYFIGHQYALLFRHQVFSYAVLIKGTEDNIEERTEACVKVLQNIMEETGRRMEWVVAIGESASRLSLIKQCYYSAMRAYSFRYLCDGKHILRYSNLEKNQDSSFRKDGEYLKNVDVNALNPAILQKFLGNGLMEEVESFVRDYFYTIGKEPMESLVFRNYVVLNVRFSVMSFLKKLGCGYEETETEETEAVMEEISRSTEAAISYAQNLIKKAIEIRDENAGNQTKSVLQGAVEFINHHYMDEELSLNTAAHVANVSANHFSALFSQNMGQTFIEYLTSLRMSKARELLRCTAKRSSEIAGEVGYKDAHYFSYLFKKTQGMTPSEYRKMKGKKTNKVWKTERKKRKLENKIRSLLLTTMIPVILIMMVLLFMFWQYTKQYSKLSRNLAVSSEFNLNFKDEVDARIYYVAIGSRGTETLPYYIVQEARDTVDRLEKSTGRKESMKSIYNLQSYLSNLQEYMTELTETKRYDDRISFLESYIYVCTSLIVEEMQNYIYQESMNLVQIESQLGKTGRMLAVGMAILVILTVLILLRRFFWFSYKTTEPITEILSNVKAVGKGNFDMKKVEADSLEIQELDIGIRKMAERIKLLLENVKEEQRIQHMTELQLIQAQVSPHFLYNTLDTIVWLIEGGQDEDALNMITSLSVFFRTSLSKGKDIITLEEEERHTLSYLEIQQFRYRDILDFEIQIPESLKQLLVPKLTLQPLAENALYHGIKNKRGKGKILIEGIDLGEDLILRVTDTGQGMTKERLQEVQTAIETGERKGFGLAAVSERIHLYYGSGYGLKISSKEGEGTVMELYLAKKMQNEDVS